MIILYIIILALAIWLNYFVATQFQSAAADKGYQGNRFFHLPFWLGLPGWLLVVALPDRKKSVIDHASKPATNITVYKNAPVENNKEDINRTCQMCGAISSNLTQYTIKDDLGTRHRIVCEVCAKKLSEQQSSTTDVKALPPVSPTPTHDGNIICPTCGTKQRSDRSVCWNCEQRFIRN